MQKRIPHTQPILTNGAMHLGPLSELLSVRLRGVDIFLTRGFSLATAKWNVRSGLISCLGLIVGNPGISQTELAQPTGTDKSVIVSIVDTLEERGWAKRIRSETDRRRHALYATPDGEKTLSEMVADIRNVEATLMAQIPKEQLDQLSEILCRMHESCIASILASTPA